MEKANKLSNTECCATVSLLKAWVLVKEILHMQMNISCSDIELLEITLCIPKLPKGSGLPVFTSIKSTSLSKMRSLPYGNASGM
jgi:hypothetical protein